MALKVSGVKLVVKDLSGFLTGLSNANVGVTKMDNGLQKLQRRIESLANTQANAALRLDSAKSAYNAAVETQKAYKKSLDATIAAIEIAIKKGQEESGAQKEREARKERLIAKEGEYANKVTQAANAVLIAENNLAMALKRSGYAAEELQQKQEALRLAQEALADGASSKVSPAIESMAALLGVNAGKLAMLAKVLGFAGLAFAALGVAAGAAMGVLKAVGNIILWVGNAAINAAKFVGNLLVSAFRGLWSIVDRVTEPLRRFIGHVAEIVTGLALYDWLKGVTQRFQALSEEVFNAVSEFQKLEIMLSALAARDYANAMGVDMATAFDMTSAAAGNLFDWLRKLAVTTPFGMADISRVFALSQAMGLAADVSQEMTSAVINYTSAMGLEDEVMWRIIYNFGQMIQRGKLSGEEFRDLSRNFVPINQILGNLAAKVGMSTEAFRELAMEGGVPVMDFLNEFVRMVNADFPGAAQKMSRTIGGVMSNIKDFIQAFIGVDVIKPLMDRIAGILADTLDRLLKDQTLMNSTKLLGQALVRAFDIVYKAANAFLGALRELFIAMGILKRETTSTLTVFNSEGEKSVKVYSIFKSVVTGIITIARLIENALNSLTEKFRELYAVQSAPPGSTGVSTIGSYKSPAELIGERIKKAIENAKTWGYNLLKNFVAGIAKGMSLLAEAITTIAGFLKKWLAPGSPPLITPEIDDWGTATMNEWLMGFTKADFDMIGDLSGIIEDFLSSIGTSSDEEELGVLQSIIDSKTDIISSLAAVKAGTLDVTSAINKMVNNISGNMAPQFAAYATTLFQIAAAENSVAAASQKVADEQAKINAITSKYDKILADLNAQLNGLTEGYEQGIRLQEIDEALANQRLTAEERVRLENEKKSILLEQQIAETERQRDAELAAANESLAAAETEQEKAENQLTLLQAQAEIQRSQIESVIEMNELLNRQAELMAQIEENAAGAGEEVDNIITELSDLLNSLLTEDNTLGQFDFSTIFGDANLAIDEMRTSFDKLMATIWSPEMQTAWTELQTAYDVLMAAFVTDTGEQGPIAFFLEKLGELQTLLETIGTKASGMYTSVETVFKDIKVKVLEPNFPAVRATANEWDKLWDTMSFVLLGGPGGGGSDKLRGLIWEEVLEKARIAFLGFYSIGYHTAKLFRTLFLYFTIFWKLVFTVGELIGKELELLGKFGLFGFNNPENAQGLIDLSGENAKLLSALSENWSAFFDELEKINNSGTDSVEQGWSQLANDLALHSVVPDMLDVMLTAFQDRYKDITTETDTTTKAILAMFTTLKDDVSLQLSGLATAVSDFSLVLDSLSGKTVSVTLLYDLLEGTAPLGTAGVVGMASGGYARAGRPMIVGENRPELFIPDVSGVIAPFVPKQYTDMLNHQISAPSMAAPTIIYNTTNVEVNAAYSQMQSEASIRYDVAAALAAAGR